jgi:deferrochelatase/peroxidase EfeB
LDVLIGYGPSIFELEGAKKAIPRDMRGMQFSNPKAGRPILHGSGITYATDNHINLGHTEHVLIQFISNSQLATHRAVVDTWRLLVKNDSNNSLKFSKFYSGFQRDDGRSWLGFHDGVSNLKSNERIGVISVNEKWNRLMYSDLWTKNGTYLGFLRIVVNIAVWDSVKRNQQEMLIGREKIGGRPIIAMDKSKKPVINKVCPKYDEIREYTPDFHDHPSYFDKPKLSMKKGNIDIEQSVRLLNQSHIGRTRHFDNTDYRDPSSNRIFRQGFEFVEPTNDSTSPIKAGLNFVSFQNDPRRLLSLLSSPHWLGGTNFAGDSANSTRKLLTVDAAGIFIVPQHQNPFPGSCILD